MDKKVNYIPVVSSYQQKKVGIYFRVSTNDTEQLNSQTIWICLIVVASKIIKEHGNGGKNSNEYN